MSAAFGRLVEALEQHGCRVAGQGRKRMATCPAHEDRNASLSLGDSDDRALVWCFAGCPASDILAAIGWRYSDLFDGGNDRSRPASDSWAPWQRTCPCLPVAAYSYESATGRLLYQVVRGQHKEFAQRRPDPASWSGWQWGLGGIEPVLFHLPRIAQMQDRDVIFITEGEKDVLALEAAGEFATTCPGGARSERKPWLPAWTEALAGRDVLVVADRDEPGREHAWLIYNAIKNAARFAWIVQAASGKDAADHLAAGLTVNDFVWWEL